MNVRGIRHIRARYRWIRGLVRNLGLPHAVPFLRSKVSDRIGRTDSVYQLRAGCADHPLLARSQTSDLAVFAQVFVEREYSCLDDLEDIRFVLDCGANVGYSSAYFLSRWPTAAVTAVEPEPGNFAILRANLAPYGDRASAVLGAVWAHPCRLEIAGSRYRDGRDWARQVREREPDEPGSIPAFDVRTLLEESGHARISLLKIDIEGAEAVLFAGDCDWLDRVDNLTVELHDDTSFGEASAVFRRAIEGRGFLLGRSGELTVCRRRPA